MLSIIIPTCNRNDLLANCLDCLAADRQHLNGVEYEIIVTDDSKDNRAKQLIEEHYPAVKWVEGPKHGPASNRNNGAKQAIFNWLVFIDDDCLPSPQLLRTYYDEIVKGEFLAFEGAIDAEKPQERYDEEAPINLHGGCFWSCNIAIAKSLYQEVGGFDEGFPYPAMEDVDFHVRVQEKTAVKFLSDALVIHPWRIMVAFKSYRKHLTSQKYFENKHHVKRAADYRMQRFKILVGFFFKDIITLAKYSFKGTGFFIERFYLNFLLIFS